MIWWILLFLLLAVVAAVIIWPFWLEARKPKMTDELRRAAPGEFIKLSRGLTHYQWLGSSRGPVAVCVHGLTTPSFVWGPIAAGLGKLGFRVLVYDLYGRGYSDRPRGPQDGPFFVAQLADLLEALEVEEDVTLVGYSMGGAVITAFAGTYPEKLRQMVLLAPAGMGHDLGPIVRLVQQRPWLGRWMMLALYGRSLRQSTEEERDLPSAVEGIVDLQQNEINYRGFIPAVTASMRGMIEEDLEETHREIGREGIQVLAIWGRDDEVIPISAMGKLAQWNRAARHEVIEGAGHGLAYTHSDEVLYAMRDLMRD
ncbi:alpha/beta hydrolase [Roseovarius faecimaris]|uniref:Alpha/beta hydrolase n=1 Tax=Roseovarius faecimaris TaxID=2494550 RepID=A0A6I6IUF1_9RHOB|nr:alpha/beta hydrolase [Roseovarius faecimaris]QGX99832.1 alpha/beta hydrolase [Roseovarius faecimaris]